MTALLEVVGLYLLKLKPVVIKTTKFSASLVLLNLKDILVHVFIYTWVSSNMGKHISSNSYDYSTYMDLYKHCMFSQ